MGGYLQRIVIGFGRTASLGFVHLVCFCFVGSLAQRWGVLVPLARDRKLIAKIFYLAKNWFLVLQ